MVNTAFVKYIKDDLEKGFSKQQIVQKSIQAGYGRAEIDEAFRLVESRKQGWKNWPAVLLVVFVVACIVFGIMFLPSLNKPKLVEYDSDPLLNIYMNEVIMGKEIVNPEEYLDMFMEKCDNSENNIINNSNCNVFSLFILTGKMKDLETKTGKPYILDVRRRERLDDIILPSKNHLLKMEGFGAINGSREKLIIASASMSWRLSDEEKENLSNKYYLALNDADPNKIGCLIYWNKIHYLMLVYDVNNMNDAVRITPKYSKEVVGICEGIKDKSYDEFCTDEYSRENADSDTCLYYDFFMMKDFCGALSQRDYDEARGYIEKHSESSGSKSFCIDVLKNYIDSK